MPQPYKVFTIYAREDAQYLKELRGQLRPLEIAGRIKIWSDTEINPGVDWENEIMQNLGTADIILILVSAAYYDSAYIHEKEIKYALQKVEAKLLPVILRPCSWNDDPVIRRLHVLPKAGKPVTDWQNRDNAVSDNFKHKEGSEY